MSIGRHRHQPLLLLKKPHTLLPCKAVQEKRTTLCTASLPIALIFIPTANIFLPLRFKMFTRSNRRKERRSSKEIALRLGLTPWRNLKYIRAAGTPRPYEIDKRPANAGALPATGIPVRSSTQCPRRIGIPSDSCHRSYGVLFE